MEKLVSIKIYSRVCANTQSDSLCLNELKTNPPGDRSPDRRTGTSMCYAAPAFPWALRILNALQRGPQGGGQDARSNFVPFMQYAG